MFKKKSPIFYILIAWVISTALMAYFIYPLISANFGYYFNNKKTETQKNIEVKPGIKETPKSDEKVLENKIIIPKINVEAPISESASINDKYLLKAMESGVVRYPINPKPGEIGNVFITGHSSNYRWAKGSYNYIFANLNKVQKDDLITVYYKGVKFVYRVFDVVVVSPKDVSVLSQTEDSIISIMTCDPPGTTWKRRVVKGIQIEPNPKNNKPFDSKNIQDVGNLIGN